MLLSETGMVKKKKKNWLCKDWRAECATRRNSKDPQIDKSNFGVIGGAGRPRWLQLCVSQGKKVGDKVGKAGRMAHMRLCGSHKKSS